MTLARQHRDSALASATTATGASADATDAAGLADQHRIAAETAATTATGAASTATAKAGEAATSATSAQSALADILALGGFNFDCGNATSQYGGATPFNAGGAL